MKQRLLTEVLCKLVFGTDQPYCSVMLNENLEPILVLHNGYKNLSIADFKNGKWEIRK